MTQLRRYVGKLRLAGRDSIATAEGLSVDLVLDFANFRCHLEYQSRAGLRLCDSAVLELQAACTVRAPESAGQRFAGRNAVLKLVAILQPKHAARCSMSCRLFVWQCVLIKSAVGLAGAEVLSDQFEHLTLKMHGS